MGERVRFGSARDLGARIKLLRETHGMTVTERRPYLAAFLGLTSEQYGALLATAPDPELLEVLLYHSGAVLESVRDLDDAAGGRLLAPAVRTMLDAAVREGKAARLRRASRARRPRPARSGGPVARRR